MASRSLAVSGRSASGSTGPNDQLSFARRRKDMQRPATPFLVEADALMRGIDRAPPGDIVRRQSDPSAKPELVKQRSRYFEDAFSVKDVDPVKERVRNEAMVLAELKINFAIENQISFVERLACQLSIRYQRLIESIGVTLHTEACMLFAGSLEPAYTMTITALPPQIQPATNKRNAALLQRFLHEALGVPPTRGVVRFVPTPEDNLAHGGVTVAGRMDDLQRSLSAVRGGSSSNSNQAARTGSARSKLGRRLSVKQSFASLRAPTGAQPMPSSTGAITPLAGVREGEEAAAGREPRRKKSFAAWSRSLFGG